MSLFSSAAPTARRLTLTAGALFAAATFASPAEAAFTTGKCGGDNITAAGASFATNAHQLAFGPNFSSVYCAEVGTPPSVTYTGSGSGAGRQIMGARTVAAGGDNSNGSIGRTLSQARLAGTDEPVTPIDQANMNKGSDAVGDEGTVRTLPLAVGSVAIIINVPDGCSIATKADGSALGATELARVSDAATANTRRLQITKTQLEQIYAGDAGVLDTWGALIPWLNDGNGTAGQPADARCQSFPLVKVRRLDDSGTTYALKDYLAKINPGRGWLTAYNTPDTRTWPNDTRTVAFDYDNNGTVDAATGVTACGAQYGTFATGAAYAPGGTTCKETAVPLLQTSELSPGTGGGAVVNKVNDFDGAIGYADLATARSGRSQAFERQANATDDKYWTKIESKDATTFVDPQAAAAGFVTNGARGSSCNTAAVSGLPTGNDPSLGNWTTASAVNSTPKGYGLCSLTYALAWDDYATPYALIPGYNAANEERKARTVRDYLESALTTGQLSLNSYDYAPLPESLATSTVAAVRQIGFAKSGGGGGSTPPVVIPDTGNGTPVVTPSAGGSTVQPPAAIVAPSNLFTVGKPRSVKGAAAVTVQVPGAGSVSVIATATIGKKKKAQIASAASTAKAGGPVALTLKPNSAAAKQLKKAKKLKVALTITFTPAGGQPKTSTVSVTLKPKAAKKAAKKKK